jgi:hypothetical protein
MVALHGGCRAPRRPGGCPNAACLEAWCGAISDSSDASKNRPSSSA